MVVSRSPHPAPIHVSGFVGVALLLALLAIAPPAQAGPHEPTITFLGSFYSEIQGEEYLYRDQIDLWREGPKLFGLTLSASMSNPDFDRFEGTLDEKSGSVYLSGTKAFWPWFRGMIKDSVLTGGATSEEATEYRLAQDPMGSHASQARVASYEVWRAWADSLIDDAEARDPGIQKDIQKCYAGDAWSCLNVGNGLKYRKPEEARRYWKKACDDGNWAGCKFLGDHDRYLAILYKLCDSGQDPSQPRNMACEELGTVAEKAGRIDEAVHWYEIGCNGYKLPTTCCNRLKALQRDRQDERHPR